MDPITHGMIGLAISTFSGNPVTLTNPIAIGCALGAMSPDLDTVLRFVKDDLVYLKHHRGWSHSVPSLAALSIGITGVLAMLLGPFNFLQVLLWTFIGALSHTMFDILNSYGAKLFKKKRKASLLTLYDPVISLLGIYLVFSRDISSVSLNSIIIMFGLYLMFRYYMKFRAKNHLMNYVRENGCHPIEIEVLPSLLAFYKWDFIIKSDKRTHVGKYNQINGKITLVKQFDKSHQQMINIFNNSRIGEYFNEFSSNLHIEHNECEDEIKIKAIDLRYYMKDNFMHHAILTYNKKQGTFESTLYPYSLSNGINVLEHYRPSYSTAL